MKNTRIVAIGLALAVLVSSCSVFAPSRYGCKSNGKNVGAEKLLDGSKVPKAKKFKA